MARRNLLIAGIAEGLGAEIAGIFAEAGYDVVGLSRSNRSSEQVRNLVERGGGTYVHLACDLTRPEDVSAMLRAHAGHVDTLIHNAQLLMIKPFAEISAVDFEQVWRSCCLASQDSSAWTQELDLRPLTERF
jgi:NAD(P)-dependent dehydrogenase (short-subunit alcohol dehydrogenase family)